MKLFDAVRVAPLMALLLLAIAVCPAFAASASPSAATVPTPALVTMSGPTVRVALVKTGPPFVNQNGLQYTGYAIDLWEHIAAAEHWNSTYAVYPHVKQAIEAVAAKQADVAVSNISITAKRREIVDFSQPFFDSGLQIMVDSKREAASSNVWTELVDSGQVRVFVVGGGLIVLASVLLTLFERRFNPEFPQVWGEGLAESLHNVSSVAFTGKSAHKPLPGAWGKVFATFWLIAGVGIVAYITSTVTSVMTANRLVGTIHGPADLVHKQVGTIAGTAAETYLTGLRFSVTPFDKLDPMVKALGAGTVGAVVFDYPTLRWYASKHVDLHLATVGAVFDSQQYGFALQLGSPLRAAVDRRLLQYQESGYTGELKARYFGASY